MQSHYPTLIFLIKSAFFSPPLCIMYNNLVYLRVMLRVILSIAFLALLTGPVFSAPGGDTVNTEKSYHIIKQDYLGFNDEYETPYYILVGKQKGPVMILDGEVVGRLTPDQMKQRIREWMSHDE